MKEGFKEAKSGNVVKLEKEGDLFKGKFRGIEESKLYKDSYVLKVEDDGEIKVCFVNVIVHDFIITNSIGMDHEIILEFKGMKKSKLSGKEYKDFKLFFK